MVFIWYLFIFLLKSLNKFIIAVLKPLSYASTRSLFSGNFIIVVLPSGTGILFWFLIFVSFHWKFSFWNYDIHGISRCGYLVSLLSGEYLVIRFLLLQSDRLLIDRLMIWFQSWDHWASESDRSQVWYFSWLSEFRLWTVPDQCNGWHGWQFSKKRKGTDAGGLLSRVWGLISWRAAEAELGVSWVQPQMSVCPKGGKMVWIGRMSWKD